MFNCEWIDAYGITESPWGLRVYLTLLSTVTLTLIANNCRLLLSVQDIKYTCYACTGKQDGESGTDPSDENDDLSSDDSDVDNDNNFLH